MIMLDIKFFILYVIVDGSPKHLEDRVKEALDILNHDPNSKIRRRTHKVMGSYLKTGKWNIL